MADCLVIKPVFRIGQKVLIEPISVTGKVVSYYYLNQIEYRIRYFDNSEVREVYFCDDELKAV